MNITENAQLRSACRGLTLQDHWDSSQLRRAFGQFATGVTVITTRSKTGLNVGLTANSFSSLSLDPALISWSLGIGQRSLADFQSSSHFAINILSAAQIELARRFSSTVEHRFAGVDFVEDEVAAPVIRGCTAWLICRCYRALHLGDHLLFVGKVEALGVNGGEPLLFHDGRYGALHDDAAARQEVQ